MSTIKDLKPNEVWKHFHSLTQIPRPSKKEKEVIEYMRKFGKNLGLETIVDDTGNVIIKKPATPGYENRKCVCLQGHLDMVPQKNSDKNFNFEKDPIVTLIDGDWVTADGTTLGSDNGIGVAAAMAVLESKTVKHGPLEALFTVDEETGMTGAFNLKPGLLKADILINMDSEDEGELYVGCAGGVDVVARRSIGLEPTPKEMSGYRVVIKGLRGGHSGLDINLGRANANKLLFRFLMQAEADLKIRLSKASGGDLRNAIPREATALVAVPEKTAGDFAAYVENYERMYRLEFAEAEPNLSFTCEKTTLPGKVIVEKEQYRLIRAVFACPNGVQRMSSSVEGLVETSSNLAIVRAEEGAFEAISLTRSSVDSAKEATAWKIAAVFHLIDADVQLSGNYPGWKPNMESLILKTCQEVYHEKFGKIPKIKAIHAGLECGLLGGVYPNLDMISFGPTIRFPHSPDEKVNIETVYKFWKFLVAILDAVPVK
ncbi:MAG: aminoacyl-histidine dipeptidase [Bacteroidales bacterium]|nr:aminoacyl-histidine dipeptidase [Bacteroidales bacterium]MBN2698485.1 aminoacyl-histidine dipeptidase [Bacteroidales bacterium]